jgi:hypothetical protein
MLKKMRRHWLTQVLIWVTVITTTGSQLIPADAWAGPRVVTRPINWNRGLGSGQQSLSPDVLQKVLRRGASNAPKKPDARVLTEEEMRSIKGRGPYRNKYLQGVLPWHRQIRDANVCTGNLFKSFTDIQVAPARGAGLALQRTYNSDDARIGPFGVGWTHAYDIRNQDESSAPVTDETLNLSDRADFFGGQHKYHRDADGLYTPPAYLYDELSSEYDAVLVNGPISVHTDQEVGMDGTIKHFIAGQSGGPTVNPERVCDYIKDRYGNQTNLVYTDIAWPDGSTKKLLSTVTDPSGRSITFGWTNLGTQQAPAYRITSAAGPLYTVAYQYNVDFNLSSVTLDSAGVNRTTTFGYTTYSDMGGTETGLLSSVVDPLGHVQSYTYAAPNTTLTGTMWVNSITEPAGVDSNNNPRTITWTIGWQIPSGHDGVAQMTVSRTGARA